jgi:hypothetical protein
MVLTRQKTMELYGISQKMLIQHKFLIGLGIKQNRQICEARSDNDTPAGPPSAEKKGLTKQI